MDAYDVKRRTLFGWKQRLNAARGKLESLNSYSRAPKAKRRRLWPPEILEEIKRLRGAHPNLGKEKLHAELKIVCDARTLTCPKPRTIGRIIKDLGGLRRVPQRITGTGLITTIKRQKRVRKPKDLEAEYLGHVVALDTFEEHISGARRYVITFYEHFSRFGFAWATTSHASKAAEEFFAICRTMFPYPITFVLTDNGSKFKKHFALSPSDLHLTHFKTRPKTPQNAHFERFTFSRRWRYERLRHSRTFPHRGC